MERDGTDHTTTATATATATVTATTTNKQELWVKVDAEGCGKGQKLADYCLEVLNQVSSQVLKGYFLRYHALKWDTQQLTREAS